MGKHTARKRMLQFESINCTKSGKRDVGGRWRENVTRLARFQIDCGDCGASWHSDDLVGFCIHCRGGALLVTDLAAEKK